MKDYVGVTKPINNVATAIPNLDWKYGPYTSLDDAKSKLIMKVRSIGLTVGIKDNTGNIVEWWFNRGITNTDLIEKQTGDKGNDGDTYVPIFINDLLDI